MTLLLKYSTAAFCSDLNFLNSLWGLGNEEDYVIVPARQLHRLAEEIHSLESIPGLHKRLKILALSWFLFHGMVLYFLLHGKEFRGVVSSADWFGAEFREFAFFWFHGTKFRVVFSSGEGFGTELWEFASIFVPRNGIPSYFLFRGRVWNGIPSFSVPQNNRKSAGNNHLFRLFRLPRNYFFVGNSQP